MNSNSLKHMMRLIEKYSLYVIPLCSITPEGKCTCGKVNCASPGKHPHFKYNWKLTASNDLQKISKWTNTYSNLNWGVLTGRRSPVTNKFLTVVDIDKRNHAIIKTLTSTFSYTTGQGSHYWYWSDKPVRNSVGLLAKNVDIRGTNGYVVIPPSKHISGREYKFLKLMNYEVSDLPDFNLKGESGSKTGGNTTVVRKKSTNALNIKTPIWKVRENIEKGKKIPSGLRNTTIHRLLSSDRSKGADDIELIKQAECYREHCEDSITISNHEIARIVYSVLKYPPNKNLASRMELTEEAENFLKTSIASSSLFLLPIREVREAMRMHLPNSDYVTDQWLAGQLETMGYKKKRTSSGNRWLLRLI